MRITKICVVCSVGFTVWPSNSGYGCCSRACSAISRRRDAINRRDRIVNQPEDYKIIVSSNGLHLLISNEDYDIARVIPWQVNSSGYALATEVMLHRLVMSRWQGLPDGMRVDHRNRDKLDCRRQNLRLATSSQNNINVPTRRNKSSRFVGVKLTKWGTWAADLWLNGTNIWVGSYDNEDEAAWMRDQWAIELHGDFANLNFAYQ